MLGLAMRRKGIVIPKVYLQRINPTYHQLGSYTIQGNITKYLSINNTW